MIDNPVHGHYDSATYPYLIFTDNAILNRNHEAVHIEDHIDSLLSGRYRFVNTVFTSRNLASDFVTWPKPWLLKQTGVPPGYDTLLPPYVLNGWYSKAMTRDGAPAYNGIKLQNVRQVKGPSGGPYTFTGVHIGDDALWDYRNVFDNMRNGIEAYSSTVYVHHSTFSDMYPVTGGGVTWGGMGIYSWTDPTMAYLTQIGVKTPAAEYAAGKGNEFFENYTAVEASHHYDAAVVRARVRTSNTTLALGGIGHTGIRLQAIGYNSMRADSNTLRNCVNSIYLSAWAGAGVKGHQIARWNTIWGTPGANYSSQNIGIQMDEITAGTAYPSMAATIENNMILDVFNGIGVANFYTRQPFIYNNVIRLQPANSPDAQYGIQLTNNNEPTVTYNEIGSTDKNNDDARAFYASQNALIDVGCNTEDTIGRGFEFADPQPSTFWHQNEMRYNQNGFVVGGDIGQQGNSSTGHGNQWLPGGSWIGPTAVQTRTVSYNPLPNSRLYVVSSSTERPLNNLTTLGTPYTHTGIFTSSSIWPTALGSIGINCASPPSYTSNFRITGPHSSNNVYYRSALERIAQDSIPYGGHWGIQTWLGQRALYYSILADSTFADSSAILRSFLTSAAGTRYAWLANIDQAIAAGKDSLAAALLVKVPRPSAKVGAHNVMIQDLFAADGIVANFDTFYHFYFDWKKKTIDSTKEAALERFALKCPMLEGPAIYQARALLRILSGNIIIYRDTCLAQGGVEGHNEEGNNQRNWIGGKGIIQQYRLIPNPNDGQICLSQAIKDDMPVNIKVFNAIGAVVYSSEKRIEARAAFIDLSALAPGVYNMVLRDSNGDDYKLKFVKR